jgi:hypothetical protein
MTYAWFILPILSHIVLPIGYASLCVWMVRRRVWWFTYLAYFFVFGSFGGWCVMVEVASLGAVPMTAFPALAMEFFLITAGVSTCFISSVILQFRKKKDRFERGAMFGGYAYLLFHSAFIGSIIFQGSSR